MRHGVDIVWPVTGVLHPAVVDDSCIDLRPRGPKHASPRARGAIHTVRPAGSARAVAYPCTARQPQVDITHVNPQGHWPVDTGPRAPHERPAFRALCAIQSRRPESGSTSTHDALGPMRRPRAGFRTPTVNGADAGVSERRHRPALPACGRSASRLDRPLQPAQPPHHIRPRSPGITPLRAACTDRASRRCGRLVPIFDTTVDHENARPFTHPIGQDPVGRRPPCVVAASAAAPTAVDRAVDASRGGAYRLAGSHTVGVVAWPRTRCGR